MLAEERGRLHQVPAEPYAAALGETRRVGSDQAVRWRSVRDSTPRAMSAGRCGVGCTGTSSSSPPTSATAFNGRPHRETGRAPVDMLAEEQARLHAIPSEPFVAALGERRVVTRSSVVSLGGVRYSVPHTLIDDPVFVRVEGDEVVIAHQAATASPRLPAIESPPRATPR